MSARAKKKNLFGTPKALVARQTTPARGGVAAHAARGTASKGGQGTTLVTYEGYRIWKDAEGEYRFSGDPESAFASLRVVKGHIDWLKKGRGNPHDASTAVVESEIPVFRSGPAGFPGVDYMISYPELNQAIAYAQAVKGAYQHVGVVCLEEAEEKLPGGDYAVVLDAAAVRAVEAGQVGDSVASRHNPVAYGRVQGRGWIQEWYETAGSGARERAGTLRKLGYRVSVSSMGTQVTPVGSVKMTMVDIRPGTSGDSDLERVPSVHVERMNPQSHAHLRGYEDGHAHVGHLPEDTDLAKQAGRRGCSSREDKRDYCQGFKAAMTERRRNPRARIVEYDGTRWKVVGTVKTGAFAGQLHLRSLSDDAEAIVDPSSVQTVKGARPNPEDAAAEMYESFHGRPADRVVEVTEELHEHEWLADLGGLVSFHIETPTGLEADLEFTSDAPKLASNEAGTQLFVVGGKQTINLKPLKMDGPDWRKESMVLGWIWVLTYNTEKAFDKFESIDYYHKLSETERGSIEKRRKTLPSLRYDSVNEKLYIDGGKYRIEKPLVGTSPGIEN